MPKTSIAVATICGKRRALHDLSGHLLGYVACKLAPGHLGKCSVRGAAPAPTTREVQRG